MEKENKTHYKKAFNSPYLSSDDIVEPTILTIQKVSLEPDQTKKTKDKFNTAYFKEREIRPGETLKPMILNVTNSRTMKLLTGSSFIDDWTDIPVTVFVDNNVRHMGKTVDGLRIATEKPRLQKPELMPESKNWNNAIIAYKRDGNFSAIEERNIISDKNKALIKKESKNAVD
jgi:hypothetical protein